MNNHFVFTPHLTGTYPAFSTPTKAIRVTSAPFTGGRLLVKHEDTGGTTRTRKHKSQGAVNASGSLAMYGYPVSALPWLFRALLTDVTQTSAGSGFINHMLPADNTDIQLPWWSIQTIQNTAGQNVRGAVPSQVTLECTAGEMLNISADFIANDIVRAATNWTDGTTSPGIIANPTYHTDIPPLRYHEGQLLFGGTVSKSGNQLVVTGATANCNITSFSLGINTNAEALFTICDGAPTSNGTRLNEREIELSAEIDWQDFDTSRYDNAKAGDATAVQLKFVSDGEFSSGNNYELTITLARMVWPEDGAPLPDLSGDLGRRSQPIRLINLEHETLGVDWGVTFKTTDNLTSV